MFSFHFYYLLIYFCLSWGLHLVPPWGLYLTSSGKNASKPPLALNIAFNIYFLYFEHTKSEMNLAANFFFFFLHIVILKGREILLLICFYILYFCEGGIEDIVIHCVYVCVCGREGERERERYCNYSKLLSIEMSPLQSVMQIKKCMINK